jgi:hypothetical protein
VEKLEKEIKELYDCHPVSIRKNRKPEQYIAGIGQLFEMPVYPEGFISSWSSFMIPHRPGSIVPKP